MAFHLPEIADVPAFIRPPGDVLRLFSRCAIEDGMMFLFAFEVPLRSLLGALARRVVGRNLLPFLPFLRRSALFDGTGFFQSFCQFSSSVRLPSDQGIAVRLIGVPPHHDGRE